MLAVIDVIPIWPAILILAHFTTQVAQYPYHTRGELSRYCCFYAATYVVSGAPLTILLLSLNAIYTVRGAAAPTIALATVATTATTATANANANATITTWAIELIHTAALARGSVSAWGQLYL